MFVIVATLIGLGTGVQGVEMPTLHRGEIRAALCIRIPESVDRPGLARATYYLSIEGPPGVEVGTARLEDSLGGWRIGWESSSWASDERTRIDLSLGLHQVKPGVIPLPGVRLEVRPNASANWDNVAWLDPLHEIRDVPPIIDLPAAPVSPWPWRFTLVGLGLVGLGMLVVVIRRLRRSFRPVVPPASPLEIARRELHHPDLTVSQATTVLRTYLSALAEMDAPHLTPKELLQQFQKKKHISASSFDTLERLFEMGDLEKFAGETFTHAEKESVRRLTLRIVEDAQVWSSGEKSESDKGG